MAQWLLQLLMDGLLLVVLAQPMFAIATFLNDQQEAQQLWQSRWAHWTAISLGALLLGIPLLQVFLPH